MIDVGVCDCDHPRGAELVRILINHPDVELKWVTGSNAVSYRFIGLGLIGILLAVATLVLKIERKKA